MRILLTNFTHQNKMTSIIFYLLILIFNLNTLSASNMWDLSHLQASNTEHKNLVNELHQSLNELEENKSLDVTTHLSNIRNNINKLKNIDNCIVLKNNFYTLSINRVKKSFETFSNTQFANQEAQEKGKINLNSELEILKQKYLNELKDKCDAFLNPQPQKKELQQSEQIQSDLNDTWDLSEMNQESVHDGQREELENLLTRPLNKGYAETVLNDQFNTIAKLLNTLNIKAQGSYSFWNEQQNPNDFNLIQQSIASLAKKLKNQSSGEVLSSSDSDNDDKYVSFNDTDTNSDQETKNPHDDKDKNELTASDCVPQDSKKLNALAIIASVENSLNNNQLLSLNNQAQLENKLFLISLIEQLKILDKLILILRGNCKEEELNPIKKELDEILQKISQSTKIEKDQLDDNIHFEIVPNIKNKILLPLKKLCEQLPSVSASINNQSNQVIDSKTITNATTNNKPESHMPANPTPLSRQLANSPLQNLSTPDIFSDLNNEKNPLNEKNTTPIPKNKDSKTNKRTWSKPKIIFGIALFSITLYWFLKNYLFSKNPA